MYTNNSSSIQTTVIASLGQKRNLHVHKQWQLHVDNSDSFMEAEKEAAYTLATAASYDRIDGFIKTAEAAANRHQCQLYINSSASFI